MPRVSGQERVTKAKEILSHLWEDISAISTGEGELPDLLDDVELVEGAKDSLRSRTKSYHYVLPTQLVAKLADPSLDCRCLQASRGGPGAFDARTIAHKVVVPFDRQNDNVLGGSAEPYVNNPLRVPEVSAIYAAAQKEKEDWAALCLVLDAVEQESSPSFTEKVLKQVLTEIHRLLREVRVIYPVPIRISLARTLALLEQFMAEHSGGDRALAVASALFLLIGRRFGLYQEVARGPVNVADVSAGLVADLECVTKEGRIVLAVEVKDQELAINHIQRKLESAREKKVAELLFLAQKGTAPIEQDELRAPRPSFR